MDQVASEPGKFVFAGQLAGFCRINASVHRATHQGQGTGRRRVIILGHQCGSRQHRHNRLADRENVGIRADVVNKINNIINVVVEPEIAFRNRHPAGVTPVCDVNIMPRQHGFHRASEKRRKMARQWRHD